MFRILFSCTTGAGRSVMAAAFAQKYSTEDIVDMAVKETAWQGKEGGSGDNLPINSSEKYKIIAPIKRI